MKNVRVTLGSLSLAGALLASACTSSTSGGNGADGDAGGGGGGACKAYKACALVTEADVKAAFGADLGAGSESDPSATASADTNEIVNCNYDAKDPTLPLVSLSLACQEDGDPPPSGGVAALGYEGLTATPVSGLGTAAYWGAPAPDAGGILVQYQLIVFQDHVQLVFTMSKPLNGDFTVDPETAAKALATSALAGL